MEHRETEKIYETKATSLGEVASFNKEMDKRMEKQGSAPWKDVYKRQLEMLAKLKQD